MKIRRILLCEDSLEGILTAVYEAYASRYGLHDICVELIDERQRQTVLFSEYKVIETNIEYAAGVAKAIRKKISEEAFWTVYNAACAQDSAKANAIYRFIVYGLYYGSKVMEALSEPDIRLVLQLSRKVGGNVSTSMDFCVLSLCRFRDIRFCLPVSVQSIISFRIWDVTFQTGIQKKVLSYVIRDASLPVCIFRQRDAGFLNMMMKLLENLKRGYRQRMNIRSCGSHFLIQ